ncbi:MAG TPA: DUF523 domain-containing protein [Candidatus Moranbacteria bacterium]|nr:DUF523 domain-containing protein [Candidatus Moranbacteria bacterium]
MKIVSACLAGVKCAYDGKDRLCPKVAALVRAGKALLICPEQLGGLSTPRPPAERVEEKVLTASGEDVTAFFRRGVAEAVALARLVGAEEAILKARSPMCGSGEIYDGTFSRTLKKGDGCLAQALKKEKITVRTEEDL